MTVGDVVEVRQTRFPGGEDWISALVVEVRDEHESFVVHALNGVVFDDEGHTFMALHVFDKGRAWR